MKTLDDLARFVVAERLQLRAGYTNAWWVHLERSGWTMARGSGETLGTALDGAVESYLRGVRAGRERA